jgi:Tn3 transposase DDE domain
VAVFGSVIDAEHITAHWDDLLRLATSIRTGTTTSSVILKKLSAYPRQNGLAKALREVGRMERTLFTLDWIKNPDLRRRAHLGLISWSPARTISPAALPIIALAPTRRIFLPLKKGIPLARKKREQRRVDARMAGRQGRAPERRLARPLRPQPTDAYADAGRPDRGGRPRNGILLTRAVTPNPRTPP